MFAIIIIVAHLPGAQRGSQEKTRCQGKSAFIECQVSPLQETSKNGFQQALELRLLEAEDLHRVTQLISGAARLQILHS